MANLAINYDNVKALEIALRGNAYDFLVVSQDLDKMMRLLVSDGLDGQVGDTLMMSLVDLRSKLESAHDLFKKLSKAVREAADEIRERDQAIRF